MCLDVMNLLLNVLLCCTFCYAAEEAYPSSTGEDLRSEIQEYLRSITQQNTAYPAHNIQPPMRGQVLPNPALRLSLPTQEKLAESFPQEDLPLESEGKSLLSPWPRVPFPSNSPNARARSYASSSVTKFQPITGSRAAVNAKASAFSSVRDVNDEESFDDSEVYSQAAAASAVREPDKKSPLPIQQTAAASVAYSRNSEPSAAFRQQTVDTTEKQNDSFSDIYFVAVVAGCSAAAIFGVISAGYCFYRLQKSSKAAAEVDYPAYGVTGPSKDATSPNGDRKLAQSAQMYHYQHQKQQMIAVEKAGSAKNASASDVDSEEENEEGDYTVYECPGLAPTGEMEVKNPLFNDDSTPMSPSVLPPKSDSLQGK